MADKSNGLTWAVYRVGAGAKLDAMTRALTAALEAHQAAGRPVPMALRVNPTLAEVAREALAGMGKRLPVATAGAGGVLVGEVWLATRGGSGRCTADTAGSNEQCNGVDVDVDGNGHDPVPDPGARSLASRAEQAQVTLTAEQARQLALSLEV